MVQTAVRGGVPFVLKMADGNQYTVRSGDQVMVGRAHVVIMDEKQMPHVLPLITMSGINYLAKEG